MIKFAKRVLMKHNEWEDKTSNTVTRIAMALVPQVKNLLLRMKLDQKYIELESIKEYCSH